VSEIAGEQKAQMGVVSIPLPVLTTISPILSPGLTMGAEVGVVGKYSHPTKRLNNPKAKIRQRNSVHLFIVSSLLPKYWVKIGL
jgi:hypothetical protein